MAIDHQRPFRILIVDDNEDLLELLTFRFGAEGFEVETAMSGHHAASISKQKGIDVILSDLHMPNGTGIDLVKELNNSGFKGPVFFLTSDISFSRELALNLGVREVFRKPFDFRSILNAVNLSLKI